MASLHRRRSGKMVEVDAAVEVEDKFEPLWKRVWMWWFVGGSVFEDRVGD